MRYDFDSVINRRGTNSYKWDSAPETDLLPMWVADMDFKTAQPIIDAIKKRADEGIFGYTKVPDEYYSAIIDWFSRRHGLNLEREWIVYTTGVVPAISAIIKAVTKPGDKVLVQTPVYNCFFSSIRNNDCEIVESPLIYENQTYRMDYDDLRKKTADPAVKAMILCNPHNPAGRVWTADELRLAGEICRENGVLVISDEIHCELVYPPHQYTPFAAVSQEFLDSSVTCCSSSKAFNTAGLQIANIFVKDSGLRARIDRAININEVCDVNPFGVVAMIAAYRHGGEWLDQLNEYIAGNYDTLKDFFEKELPCLKVVKLEGTYLAWIDCRATGIPSDEIERRLKESGRVWINSGAMYGAAGDGFIRINMACPRPLLLEGLRRIKTGFDDLMSEGK